MQKINIKEVARDFVALGSPIFFILIIARILFLSNYEYLSQFIIAGILFSGFFYFFKSNLYSGLGIISLIFTTLYYNDLRFSIFVFFIYIGLIASLIYLKTEEKEIFLGTLFGIVSTALSYLLVDFIFG